MEGEKSLELVDEDSSLANLIMQYVYNTANEDVLIEAIYRITIPAENVSALICFDLYS